MLARHGEHPVMSHGMGAVVAQEMDYDVPSLQHRAEDEDLATHQLFSPAQKPNADAHRFYAPFLLTPTHAHYTQEPFAQSLPSRHPEGAQHCTWGRSSDTAAARASIPGHTGNGARAEPTGQSQAGGQLQLLPERPWQKGDDTELGYGTTFILSYLRPAVVNKHVTTDEATRSHAGCFRPCITL